MTQSVFNGLFAALMARAFVVGVGEGNQVIASSVYSTNEAYQVTGADSADRTVTVPAARQISVWQADAANAYVVTIKCGTGSVSIEPGQRIMLATDGSANGIAGSELTGSVTTLAWQGVDDGDSPVQAVAGDHLDVDTSSGAVTVTLPADPVKYDEVWISNLARSFATHNLTVARNGQTIEGDAEDLVADIDGAEFSLRFDGTTWTIPGSFEQ